MGRLIFFTGGARSGKSRLAEAHASRFEPVVYIATAQAFDVEMTQRIIRHKNNRPKHWTTLEEALNLQSVAAAAINLKPRAILLDCITLWLSNRMLHDWTNGWSERQEQNVLSELRCAAECFRAVCNELDTIIVSNEVGSGIVPENEMSRAFRDLSGRANQFLGSVSDEAYLVAAGLPLKLK